MRILIGGADILYITINSPALMEENGAYNEDFNASSAILQLTDALSDNRISKRSRMLLFVPVKCEKYYWDMIRGANVEALSGLNQRIQECYRALIESVQTNQRLQNSTTMAITPIMTVGGAKFCQFMPDEENAHKDTYIRILGYITDKNGYRPTFCEQPLLYTLSFIHSRIQSQVKKSGLIGFFADAGALGLPTAFRFAFHDPLCDAIQRKTECADFERFKTVEDYQKTESADAGRAEMQYPEGIYGDVDIRGYSILANPQRIVDVSP